MASVSWIATNVLSGLLLPPASLLLLIAVGLWFGRKRRWCQWLAGCSLAALTLLCVPATGMLLVRSFETAYPPLETARYAGLARDRSMVVILGGGRDLGAIEYPDGERLGNASLRRARYGARIASALGVPLAVSGGKPTGGVHSEARLMRDFIEMELKQPVAVLEEESTDTRQNALHMSAILAQRNTRRIFLVTDVSHMPRAVRVFEAVGLDVVPAPVNYLAQAPLTVVDFLPSADGLEKSHRALREMLGEIWYAARRAWLSGQGAPAPGNAFHEPRTAPDLADGPAFSEESSACAA